MKFLFVTPSTL